jgi:hypothetical protein
MATGQLEIKDAAIIIPVSLWDFRAQFRYAPLVIHPQNF